MTPVANILERNRQLVRIASGETKMLKLCHIHCANMIKLILVQFPCQTHQNMVNY
jgi:hypothetical protein